MPPIYFAHRRSVFERDGMLLADNPYIAGPTEVPVRGDRCATARWAT